MAVSAGSAAAIAEMERVFDKACRERLLPGAIVVATNRNGSFYYEKAFGKAELADEDAGESGQHTEKDMHTQHVLMMASCTKLLTSVAALQCVERGLLDLDTNLASIVPELDALPVLVKVHDDEEVAERITTRKREGYITLRHLLTHTAGLGYDFMSPKLMRYRTVVPLPRIAPGAKGATVAERYSSPLLYDPGTSWGYSCALDWVGTVVARVSGLPLQVWMEQHIFKPLGIRDLAFWLSERPDMVARRAGMTLRDEDSGKAVPFSGQILVFGEQEAMGGGGIFGVMSEYAKVLRSLLRDDGVLLTQKTTAEMFRPQLNKEGHDFLDSIRDRPEVWNGFPGEFPRNIRLDWGLAGMLTMDRDEGWRGKGTMVWSGLPNLFWFIDRENDICGIFGTQVLPPGDQKCREMATIFEKAMYKVATSSAAGARL